jgi:erythromycin esterase
MRMPPKRFSHNIPPKTCIALILLGLVATVIGCDNANPVEPAPPAPPVDPVDWLVENSVHIRSIDPAEDDFSDLAPLVDILANRRVVMLGEPSHGDGATFLAKTRLVKFLHQEMGFDVLAFEGGLYDCRKSWMQLNEGLDAHEAFDNGIFAIWANSKQVQPLVDYWGDTAGSAQPLELAGFDCQFGTVNSSSAVPDLAAFLASVESELLTDFRWQTFRAIMNNMVRGLYYNGAPPSAILRSLFFAMVEDLDTELGNVPDDPDPDETAFWRQFLRSSGAYARLLWSMNWSDFAANPDSVLNMRDLQMGENLVWLAQNRYAGRKIIVWAATVHIVHNIQTVESTLYPNVYHGTENMGQVVHEELRDESYMIGFTACEGQYGSVFSVQHNTLSAFTEGSLEDLLYQTELPNLFVDFRGLSTDGNWLTEPLVSWPMGYSPMRAVWPEVMDGILCTRVMTPSTRATR